MILLLLSRPRRLWPLSVLAVRLELGGPRIGSDLLRCCGWSRCMYMTIRQKQSVQRYRGIAYH
jgi:hypothetical protein